MIYLFIDAEDNEILLLKTTRYITTAGYISVNDRTQCWHSLEKLQPEFTGTINATYVWTNDIDPIPIHKFIADNPTLAVIKSPKFPLQIHYPELFL